MTADLDPAVSPDLARLEELIRIAQDTDADAAAGPDPDAWSIANYALHDLHHALSPAVVLALIHRLRAAEEVLLNAQGERYMLDAAYTDLRKAALRVIDATQPVDRDAAILDLDCVVQSGEPCAEARHAD